MPLLSLANIDILHIGLRQSSNWPDHMLQNTCNKTKIDRFKDFFFASPKTMDEIYQDIQDPNIMGEDRIKKPDPIDFLGVFYFLKKYPTKIEQAAFLGCLEKSALLKSWKYVRAIQSLKVKKIRWIFAEGEYDEYFMVTVDGVHCRVMEPRFMPSSGWFSHKENGAGLSYEVALAVYHDNICWINGPFPAGQGDLRIFKKDGGLMSKIPDDKRVIADEAFTSVPHKASTRNEFDDVNVKDLKKRSKARQESVFTKLKSFGILNQVFRTKGKERLVKHKAAFEACCVIVQYELDNQSRKLMKV